MKVTSKVLLCLVVLLVVAAFADAEDETSPPKRRFFGFLRSRPTEDRPEGSFNWVGLIAVLAGVGVAATGAMLVQKEVDTEVVKSRTLEEELKKRLEDYDKEKAKRFLTYFEDDGVAINDSTGKVIATKANDGICDKCLLPKAQHTQIPGKKDANGKSVDQFQCRPGSGLYTEEYMANELFARTLKDFLDVAETKDEVKVKEAYAAKAKAAEESKSFDENTHKTLLAAELAELKNKWDRVDAEWKFQLVDKKVLEFKQKDAEGKADEKYKTAEANAKKDLDDALGKATNNTCFGLGGAPDAATVATRKKDAQTKKSTYDSRTIESSPRSYDKDVAEALKTKNLEMAAAKTASENALEKKEKELADAVAARTAKKADAATKTAVDNKAAKQAAVQTAVAPPAPTAPVAPPAEVKK